MDSKESLILDRLDRVKKCGKGYLAKCPAHEDKTASLSVLGTDNGGVLLHCFAGCQALDVVQALGLSMTDLFPDRLKDMTQSQRSEARDRAARAGWAAALNVLSSEALVVFIAAKAASSGNEVDLPRLAVACRRISDAKATLSVGPGRPRTPSYRPKKT